MMSTLGSLIECNQIPLKKIVKKKWKAKCKFFPFLMQFELLCFALGEEKAKIEICSETFFFIFYWVKKYRIEIKIKGV